MRDKFLGVLGMLGIVGIIVAGCSAPPAHSDEPPAGFFDVKYQLLPDGRTVMCLYKEGHGTGYAGSPIAMSCDWNTIAPAGK